MKNVFVFIFLAVILFVVISFSIKIPSDFSYEKVGAEKLDRKAAPFVCSTEAKTYSAGIGSLHIAHNSQQ